MTERYLFQLNRTNQYTLTVVDEYEISNMCEFWWYKWCHYFDDSKVSMFPFQKAFLGHVVGPANNKVNYMTRWNLKYNGNIIPRCMVKKLMVKHLSPRNEVLKGDSYAFYNKIRSILVESIDFPPAAPDPKSLSVNYDEGIGDLGPSIFYGD